MPTKEFKNKDITIIWDPEKCIHSGICVKTLPQVYNPKENPWIKMENARTKDLINQVAQCPSGALSIPQQETPINIEIIDDGKKGRFELYEKGVLAGEMTFTWAGATKLIIDHTTIGDGYNGKGYGKKMVMKAVEFAREKGIKILPLCPFANAVFEKDQSIQDVRF